MNLKDKIFLWISGLLTIALVISIFLCRYYYKEYRKATDTNVQITGDLYNAKTIIKKLENDVAKIPKEKIKYLIKIVPEIHTETSTIIETSFIDSVSYCTKTIIVKETLKDTEIILIIDRDGNVLSSEINTIVIINDVDIGFVLRPALSLFYCPNAFPCGIDILFFKIKKCYIGCNLGFGFDMIGIDFNYNFYRNSNLMIGYGNLRIYAGINVFF